MPNWIDDDQPNLVDKTNRTPRLSATKEWAAEDSAIVKSALADIRTKILNGEGIPNPRGETTAAPANKYRTRCNAEGKLEVSQSGSRWRRPVRGEMVFDIRETLVSNADGVTMIPGGLPGQANKARTRAALQNIFDTIRQKYADESPTQNGRTALVYIPFEVEGWWFDSGLLYQGTPGIGLYFIGEAGLARGGAQGTALIYDGPTGQTFFDFVALNGSVFRDLEFNGGRKARTVVWLRQKSIATVQTAASSGLHMHSCSVFEPEIHAESICCAAGKDDNPGQTYQSSEYRFYQTFFQGSVDGTDTKRARGFAALVGGNTKNFVFSHCVFTELHRGVEAFSGYVFLNECNVTNIGGSGHPGAAAFYGGGNVWTILGGGLENGNPGYAAKFVQTGQRTKVTMIGCYLAGTTYADDVIVETAGGTLIQGCDFEQSRRGVVGSPSTSTMVEWAADTTYAVGYERFNGTRAYRVITPGVSASSGGPTGTGADITDGTVHWQYAGVRDSNGMKLRANGAGCAPGNQFFGGMRVNDCSFIYNFSAEGNVNIIDGSDNPITWGNFARISRHRVYCSGNNEGLTGGNTDKPLADVVGDFEFGPVNDQIRDDANDPGVTTVLNMADLYVVTLPYTFFNSVLTNPSKGYGLIARNRRITSVKAEIGTPFAHSGGGTIAMLIGTQKGNDPALTYDEDRLLKSFDAKSAAGTVFGELKTDWGTPLQDGAGGYHTIMSGGWLSSGELLIAQVVCSGGAANQLTAGSVTLYMRHERLGPQV